MKIFVLIVLILDFEKNENIEFIDDDFFQNNKRFSRSDHFSGQRKYFQKCFFAYRKFAFVHRG